MMSVAGSWSNKVLRQRGFSLLETMIVIMVIGILYSLAGSMLNLSLSDPLNDEVERLRERVRLVQDESLVRSQALALGFGESGYTFFAQNDQLQWEAIEKDALLKAYAWVGQFKPVLYLQGQTVSLPKNADALPQVFILPTGEMMPFEWHLQDKDGRDGMVRFDNVGRVVDVASEAE